MDQNNLINYKWSLKQDSSEDTKYVFDFKKKKKKIGKLAKNSKYKLWWNSLDERQKEDVVDNYKGGDVYMFLRQISEDIQPDKSTYRKNKIDSIMND